MFKYSSLIIILLLFSVSLFLLLKLQLPKRNVLLLLVLILTIAMLIFDTYLTALPIVEYNKNLVLGIRIGSIPIEDFGYLLVVVLLGPALLERFIQNEERKK